MGELERLAYWEPPGSARGSWVMPLPGREIRRWVELQGRSECNEVRVLEEVCGLKRCFRVGCRDMDNMPYASADLYQC